MVRGGRNGPSLEKKVSFEEKLPLGHRGQLPAAGLSDILAGGKAQTVKKGEKNSIFQNFFEKFSPRPKWLELVGTGRI